MELEQSNVALQPPPEQPPQQQRAHRVCFACWRRKVRCDKKHPCQNCTRGRLQCVFPRPGSGYGHQTALDTELLDRLRRLESTFKTLVSATGEVSVDAALQSIVNNRQAADKMQDSARSLLEAPNVLHTSPQQSEANPLPFVEVSSQHSSPASLSVAPGDDVSSWSPYGKTAGKIVKDEGRDRYISGFFWNDLHSKVCQSERLVWCNLCPRVQAKRWYSLV